jgi:phosphate starvation-inducible PhoH-like protein
MAFKKSKKKSFQNEAEVEKEILSNIEGTSKKEMFCNFKITNKFKLSDAHNSYVEMNLRDETKMTIVDGPAGSAKSYCAVYAALQLLLKKKVNQIVYIRSIAESASKSMGSLPGSCSEKFEPYIAPILEKLEELVGPKVTGELIKNGYIKCVPVNFCRGLTFRDSAVIVDEIQSLCIQEATTVITRFGENSKYFLIGDSFQSDIGNKTCFPQIKRAFDNPESEDHGIHCFEFGENEVVRSEILKFLVRKLESAKI